MAVCTRYFLSDPQLSSHLQTVSTKLYCAWASIWHNANSQ